MHRRIPFVAALVILTSAPHVRAQDAAKSVADGIYSDVQAVRGAAAYDQACGRCHRQDLGGADGPALKDDRFNRNFAGRDLKELYTRIATTMPRGAPASMSEGAYLDILAHMLRENGFPAGAADLTGDGLAGVQVLPTRPKPLPAVGDFSYVEVVGCLAPAGDGTWVLNNATDPVAAPPPSVSSAEIRLKPDTTYTDWRAAPLGSRTYHLLDAMAYGAASRNGQKLYVKGLLIRLAHEQRMTISDAVTRIDQLPVET